MLIKLNKNITVEHLLKRIKSKYIYSSIEDPEVIIGFERNNEGLKKLVSFSE
jgi:hypothetical protein